MEESTTYQAVLRKGEVKGKAEGKAEGEILGATLVLIRLGSKIYGQPSATQLETIHSATSIEQVEHWLDHLDNATTWDDLLR